MGTSSCMFDIQNSVLLFYVECRYMIAAQCWAMGAPDPMKADLEKSSQPTLTFELLLGDSTAYPAIGNSEDLL